MNCHRCGNLLPSGATGCPRCEQTPPKTRRLSETDLHKTRALVQIERCENCGWIVYATDSECSACGTWINRPWKQGGVKASSRKSRAPHAQGAPAPVSSKRVWISVAISITLLCLSVLAWKFLNSTHLQ